ncbi:efflux RND transporter periplasmic adaptor subunit [Marinobacter sp. 1-4A]|uniref:efflux RND transporter periplasmic adaptor subunit n=1 Tax=Marinobacter sp. 1-4A TaxID=2582919 RepID=UPI00190566CE|nr:efflux RND transporter periplasmic adaptor subunit [Marinobacter sp. 1-4A]MBK1851899.1 efflux RND transporter periplasmic adaptor subunit [Marinobacter sp. 1-4A]
MANVIRPLGFLLLGGVAGAAATYWLTPESPEVVVAEATSNASKEPLHWVAPMDPNYKSDKPGKSPMGMDLIPIYADSGSGKDAPGTVRISPNVVNNLGVLTEPVIQGRLPNKITTVGYVQYSEDDIAHVHPRVEGWIEKLYVKAEGEPVAKGKPLYTLYSPTLVNAQDELILALNRSNERLVNAAKERLAALNVPVSLIRQITKTRELQRTLTVYAPTSGVIDNLNVREGMFIRPGDRVLSIAALGEVWVIGEVFERQLSAVASDNRVVMTLDYLPGRQWTGKVDYVYPEVNPKTRTARVRMRFDNADGTLLPGMFAELNIQGARTSRQLLVPRESVIRTGQTDRLVLALDGGAFKSVTVKVGRVGEKYAEILEGVMPGDEVVTSAQFLIDSESSKTSDFLRMSAMPADSMDHAEMDHGNMNHEGAN